jgi:hypothetical protein
MTDPVSNSFSSGSHWEDFLCRNVNQSASNYRQGPAISGDEQ